MNWTKIEERRQALLPKYQSKIDAVAAMRARSMADLAHLTAQAEQSLSGKGTKVYHAQDAAEAAALIVSLCPAGEKAVRVWGAEVAEIALDQALAANENPLYLTDLHEIIAAEGGRVVNIHPLLGYMNDLSQEEIIKALQRYLGSEDVDAPLALGKLTKDAIRSDIIASAFGITDIDAIIAENGTIVLAENEGNNRMVSNLPYRHIVVAGLDKIYPTAEDAADAIQSAYVCGLGEDNARYYSFISGQSRTADIEFRMVYGMHGPLEVHLILLDNGRRDLLAQNQEKFLRCLNCGACTPALLPLAEANGWQNTLLTCKNLALLQTRGQLLVQNQTKIDDFVCPVGIKADDLQALLG